MMACETCGAPTGWVPGEKLQDAIDSKLEFHRRIKQLESENASLKADKLYLIDERNKAHDTIAALRAELAAERKMVTELDSSLDRAIRERDAAEELGTKLADAVGEHFRVDVGEHSNMNDPRDMAIAILGGEYETDSDTDRELAEARKDAERIDLLEEKAKGRTGVSIDYAKYAEDGLVIEKGFCVMWFHNLCDRKPTIRAAIDAAIAATKGEG